MSRPLEFHRAIRDEIRVAYDWYESRLAGLGREYLDELERVLGEIAAHPARGGFVEDEIREVLLTRFPFAVYYRVLSDRIRVLAVFHTSRNPAEWRTRS